MVKWYKTYLEVYGKSFDEISDDSIRKVKRQLKERQKRFSTGIGCTHCTQ